MGTGTVQVVVVNWNTGDYLRACLEALPEASAGTDVTEVTIVDNGSTDGSADHLDAGSIPVRVLRNARNVGFARACNQGAAGSTADHLLFLNPDTRPQPRSITTVRRHLDQLPDVGIGGAWIVDETGRPSIAAARFPNVRILLGKATGLARLLPRLFPAHHLLPGEVAAADQVDQVIGAFLMIRRSLFAELGGFDERFFLYFEDVDLALRAHETGARSIVVRDAEVMHAANRSTSLVPDQRTYHSVRSRLLYARKHWRPWQVVAVVLATLAVELPVRVVAGATRGINPWSTVAAHLRGVRHGTGALGDDRRLRPIELRSPVLRDTAR